MVVSTVHPSLQVPLLHYFLVPDRTRPPTATSFYLSPIYILGSFLLYAGTILRVFCYHTLGRHFTFELAFKKDHKLITNGPYAFVRHPSYLGLIVALSNKLQLLWLARLHWTYLPRF